MMRRLALFAAAGLVAGVLAFQLSGNSGECSQIEKQIQQERTFNGSIACYPPGVIETNVTSEVKNATELRCVCRRVYNGKIHDIAIRYG